MCTHPNQSISQLIDPDREHLPARFGRHIGASETSRSEIRYARRFAPPFARKMGHHDLLNFLVKEKCDKVIFFNAKEERMQCNDTILVTICGPLILRMLV